MATNRQRGFLAFVVMVALLVFSSVACSDLPYCGSSSSGSIVEVCDPNP